MRPSIVVAAYGPDAVTLGAVRRARALAGRSGNVTLHVAAVRAGVTLGSVVVLARIGTWAVGWIADSAQESATTEPATEPTKKEGAR